MTANVDTLMRTDRPPPRLDDTVIRDFIDERYGIRPQLERLRSERDVVICLTLDGGRVFVLRVSHSDCADETAAFQNELLSAIASYDPGLPVPRIVPSLSGREIEPLTVENQPLSARLFRYLEGVPIASSSRSPSQRRNIGIVLARLNKAMAMFRHASDGDASLWDLTKAGALLHFADHISTASLRRLVREILCEVDAEIAPALATLKSQYIHNDFHGNNVLVDDHEHSRVVGIIDFGDVLRAPRVIDIAVAMARQVDCDQPIEQAREIGCGYQSVFPLAGREIALVPRLICIRLALRIAVWSWRMSRFDSRANNRDLEQSAFLLSAFRDFDLSSRRDGKRLI